MREKFYILLIILSFGNVLYGQKATEDILYLKDGSLLKGTLLELKKGELIKFQLNNGQVIAVEEKDLDELQQNKKIRESPLKTKGFYHTFYLSFNPGNNHFDEGSMGIGLEYTGAYWLNDALSLGLGTGIFNLDPSYSWNVVPLVIDFKVKSSDRSPIYVGGDLGLSFPLRAIDSGIRGGRAGERVRLGLGKIWSSKKDRHVSLEFSYLYQRSIYETWTWDRTTDDLTDLNMRFKRYQIRVGLLF